jgi:hypothetical protein
LDRSRRDRAGESRAKSVKPQEMIDTRFIEEMEKSGFFDQIWAAKR